MTSPIRRSPRLALAAATYDRRLGHPVRVAIDYHVPGVDDEVTYVVRDFTPLPPSTSP